MKRKILVPLLGLACAGSIVFALAVGGSSSDPLISLSYLNGSYSSQVNTAVDSRLDASDKTITAEIGSQKSSSGWTDIRLKQADTLSGSTGLNVMLLAGSAKISISAGAVVDVTSGTAVTNGSALILRHRYLAAENADVRFSIVSKTAVLHYQGTAKFTKSALPDFNAMADALKTLHLFRGTGTGFGSGYDLETAPTRLQALIMFIRVLGEEQNALAYTGKSPFTDVAAGSNSAKYVAYAYSKGYTNGATKTQFLPSRTVTVNQYTEFMLRALQYSAITNNSLSGTLDKAVVCGVLTSGEVSMLRSGPFLRAQLVYISYYTLDAAYSGSSDTLRDRLLKDGVFTSAESAAASSLVKTARLS